MADYSTPKKYKKGTVIFREGELGATMYDIRWGLVGIYSGYGTPEEKKLTELGPGSYFGEMGLIDTYPRSATAVVLENDTQMYEIDLDGFSDYFKNKPEKILTIMKHMGERVRGLTNDYLDACKTISEYLEAEKQNEPKSETLLSKMKKLAGIYKK